MSKKISEVFDVAPVINMTPAVIDDGDKSVSDDADEARLNIKKLVATGMSAIEHAFDVSVQSESPRAFEVLSTMMKTVADMNSQLLDIHDKKKKLNSKEPSAQQGANNVTNNAIFVGTTSDLNKIIMERLNGK